MLDGKHVILAIDDDEDFCAGIKTLLEAKGYVTAIAHTAEEGLSMYPEVKPDLILVDLMMEKVDAGSHFVKEMKLMGNVAPIFLLSGAGDSMATSTDYTELGFSGVFQKPVAPDRLLNVIKSKLST